MWSNVSWQQAHEEKELQFALQTRTSSDLIPEKLNFEGEKILTCIPLVHPIHRCTHADILD